jgi:4-oxalocrotonate tautomerase
MPIIEINLFEGRTTEQKRQLIAKVTDAVTESIGVPRTNVRIILRELEPVNFGIGGQSAADLGRNAHSPTPVAGKDATAKGS